MAKQKIEIPMKTKGTPWAIVKEYNSTMDKWDVSITFGNFANEFDADKFADELADFYGNREAGDWHKRVGTH